MNYFDEVAVKPEIEKLYLEVMGTIFKANESNREQEVGKLKENLTSAEKKLASLEEKYVLNEIERDGYSFMKPRFKEEITKLKEKLSDLESKEASYTRYLNSRVNLLQNLRSYYEAASLPNKQKLIGSIRVLKGFERDFKKERPRISRSFRPGSPDSPNVEPKFLEHLKLLHKILAISWFGHKLVIITELQCFPH